MHVWTLRVEPVFLSPTYAGDAGAEFRQFRDLGVDGLFTDFPDVAALLLRRTVDTLLADESVDRPKITRP